jgi:hypothetical protein
MNGSERKDGLDLPREVILDLLPTYASGEASATTRAIVEEHLARDPDLARHLEDAKALPKLAPSLPPELELRSLKRTRGLLRLRQWLFAGAITFTAFSLTSKVEFGARRITKFRLLIFDYPLEFGVCLALAVACWIAFVALRRRLGARAL